MNILKLAVASAALGFAANASAQIVFYEHDNFNGRQFTADNSVGNFQRFGFNDRASSVVVVRDRWEVCTDAGFGGQCAVLRPGRYHSMSAFGLNDRISSVRPIDHTVRVEDRRYAPGPAVPVYDNYRRPGERIYDAQVTSVRAVYTADGGQRCWVERDRVVGNNIGGAIVGGLIGGVLGHQVGSGRGNDLATAAGAIGGAAIGSRAGSGGRAYERCENVPTSGRVNHYEVTYNFRGNDHFIQTTVPPGPTIAVNEYGEPRG